jgi:YVTN family beta-propeller protein
MRLRLGSIYVDHRIARSLCVLVAVAAFALGGSAALSAQVTHNSVQRSLGVGGQPFGLAVDPANNRVYVVADGLYYINEDFDNVVRTDDVNPNRAALDVAVDPRHGLVLVPSYPRGPNFGGELTTVAAHTGRIDSTTRVGDAPYAVAADPATGQAVVANHASDSVSVIDDQNHRVLDTMRVGEDPMALAVNPTTDLAYCVNQIGTMSVLNLRRGSVIKTIRVGSNPSAVAVDPVTATVYVIDATALRVFNATSLRLRATVRFGSVADPSDVAVDTKRHLVFVTLLGSNRLVILRGPVAKRIATISVGRWPEDVAVDPRSRTAFVSNGEDHTVSVVSYR